MTELIRPTLAWRNQIAAWLIEGGCLYVVAWGIDCEAWHDSVDWANVDAFNLGDIPEDRFVINEPLSEALWFADNYAFHPHIKLSETIIIHAAEEERRSGILLAYHDSQKLAEDGIKYAAEAFSLTAECRRYRCDAKEASMPHRILIQSRHEPI